MKRYLKRGCCVLLAALLLCLSTSPAFGASDAYPADITETAATAALKRTDILLQNAAKTLAAKSLSALFYEAMFADETLSGALLGVYGAIDGSNASSLLGTDTSPAALSVHLKAYPAVAARLQKADSWSDVDLDGAKWQVKTKTAFSDALSAMFTPLNDLLYMLLCGGTVRLGLLPVKGDLGYENGAVPILRALGCPQITSPASFYAAAKSDRGSMVKALAASLLSLADTLCAAPMAKLTAVLPTLAIFIRDGELEKAVDALLRPLSIHIGSSVELLSGSKTVSLLLFLQSPGKYTLDFTENLTQSVNDMLRQSGITVAEIDLDAFAACKGKPTDCYMVLMRWLIATLRRNTDALGAAADAETAALLETAAQGLLRHGDEWLLSALVHLLTDAEGTVVEARPQTPSFTRGSVKFTEKLERKQMKRALAGLDGVLDEFSLDASDETLSASLSSLIYSSDTVTALAGGLYGALSGEMSDFAALLGLPASPAALASRLPARYGSAKAALSLAKSWSSLGSVSWGFAAGDRSGFEAAVTAVLRPFRPLLDAFLADGVFEVLGAVRIGGTNGYNTAVLPLLEALSCPTTHLKAYDEYKKGRGTDRILTDLLTPLLDLADKIMASPIKTLTALLPNAVFFVQSGALAACIKHLLTPVTRLLDACALSPADLGLDLSALEQLSIPDLLSAASADADAASLLADIDWNLLATLGKQTEKASKRTYHGKAVESVFIKSDRPAVLLTLLRGIITAVKKPENAALLDSMVATTGGDNAMFAQYSSGITEQMNEMTTDEMLEWLYQLLFRERATKEIKEDDGYVPDFPYEPAPTHTVRNVLLALGALLILAAGIVVLWRRREIAAWRRRRQAVKAQNNTSEEG